MDLGEIWNELSNPDRIPRIFSLVLALFLLVGLLLPFALNNDQLYPRPAPQEQMLVGDRIAPYDRGGDILETPGITVAQYPQYSKKIGMINSYMSPIAYNIKENSPYFGTSIYSSPGGLIDEILYYTRGFDTILESSILMMSFVIASWLALNFTMRDKNKNKDEESEDND